MKSPEPTPHYDDDIWADDNDECVETQTEMLSDLPTIKRRHMTDGYREGLSIGKAKVMQQGFDEGYPAGIQIGLRVGRILGVLEGYLAAKSLGMKDLIQKTYEKAKTEFVVASLLEHVDEEALLNTKGLPPSVEEVLERWEGLLFGGQRTLADAQQQTDRTAQAISENIARTREL